MTVEQIFIGGAVIFGLVFAVAAAVIIDRIMTQSVRASKLAGQYGYTFWSGNPTQAGKYPESRMFYAKLYVTACFIDASGTEVGVTSKFQRYMTMMVGPTASETLYIDSLKDNGGGNGRGFEDVMFDRVGDKVVRVELEPVVLEGNFNKSFNVLQPVGQQIETLTVLTPDVMAKMLDLFEDCNIELTKGRLTIFMPANKSSLSTTLDIEFVRTQFEKANEIRDLIARNSTSVQ
jgi:hypothetical protein